LGFDCPEEMLLPCRVNLFLKRLLLFLVGKKKKSASSLLDKENCSISEMFNL